MRHKHKSINIKGLDDKQSITHWMILLLHPALRRQVISHFAHNAKIMEQLLDPQELKTITRN